MPIDTTVAVIEAARPTACPPRASRRPFTPSGVCGPYRLPHDVRDRLAVALAPVRNRDAALSLARFLARFWSSPNRITLGFPIDRRELARRDDLGLSEARVRGAIAALEAVGFLERVIPATRSRHKMTDAGELHRKPIIYRFGADYLPAFAAANRRAGKAKDRRSGGRRPIAPAAPSRPPAAIPEVRLPSSASKARAANSPKSKSEAERKVLMGEIRRENRPPSTPAPNPQLEAALERWSRARRREP